MRFSYVQCSGQGLRFDIYDGSERIAITHTKKHAEFIIGLLNSKGAK